MIPSTSDRIEAARQLSPEITLGTLLAIAVWCGVAWMVGRWAWGVL